MRGNTGTPSFFREEYQGHNGACVVVRPVRELISPKRFFTDEKTKFSIDGVRLEVYMIPGESADYVAVWLPDAQALFSGDHVYGSFPNLYPIRGGDYRNVERWARGVRRLGCLCTEGRHVRLQPCSRLGRMSAHDGKLCQGH